MKRVFELTTILGIRSIIDTLLRIEGRLDWLENAIDEVLDDQCVEDSDEDDDE